MSSEIWIAIATVIGAIFTAIASSGLVGAIQNKGKISTERKKIEEDIISQIRTESDKRNKVLEDRAELNEYKFDMLLERHLELIDKIRKDYESKEECVKAFMELRTKALELKYLDKIPGRVE